MEDRLVRVEDASGTVIASYYYDPFGRRLWKEVSGVRTNFLYSDEGLVGEYDDAGNEIRTYGWQPGSTWGTDPLFMKQGDEYYYYRNDHLGTPQQITDKDGVVVWQARYQAFGKAVIDGAATVVNNLRFPGHYYDGETGFHYNWQRYYDPETGRYLAADPIGLAGGGNLYLYADQNPINKIDPLGLYRDIGGGFGVTAGIVAVSFSVSTDTCCDDQGNKHLRTIQTFTIGWEIGLGLKGSGGASASLSDDKKVKKCPKNYDASGYYSDDSGVWGALILGRSYSKSGGTGWKVGLGGGWSIYSGSRNDILKDVIVGKCCSEQ